MAVTNPHSSSISSESVIAPDTAISKPKRGEWHGVALILLTVLILTSLPFIFAYATTPDDRHFTGVMFNIPDHNQYFAWMRDLAHESLAPNRLTAEPNEPAFFNLLWWSVGRFGALAGWDYATLFGSLRILAIFFFLGVAYLFFRITVDGQRQRLLTFGLFAFGGGLGIMWVVVKYLQRLPDAPFPFDIYTSEPNSFFIALAFPHFGIALGLLVAMIGLVLFAQQRQQLRYAFAAGLVGALIGLQHAYDLLTIATILGLFGLLIWLRDRRFPLFLFKSGLIIALLTAPPVAYLSYLVLTDATWGGKLAQFDNAGAFTPNLLHLPILMGVPLLLALAAFRPRMLQSRKDSEILIAAWFLAHFVLIYLPLKFQIHLLLGWQIPIAILAAVALRKQIGPALAKRIPRLVGPVMVGLVGLCVVTNAYILAWRFIDLGRYEAPYYLTQNELAALNWLDTNATRNDVVLSVLEFGQHIPVHTDARAFLAHWAGTLDFFTKQEMAAKVIDPALSNQERQAILEQFAVTYVVVREQDSPAATFMPAAAGRLTPVFQQGDVTIFRTSEPTLP
ncbi:MAG: hypothetical protein MI924_22055 [Chloroflexales bacterium]|nr:hypothetical protein [Chloroflexales bacterium]